MTHGDAGESTRKLEEALSFLEVSISPSTVVHVARGIGLAIGTAVGAVALALAGIVPAVLSGTAAGLLASAAGEYAPRWLARTRRTRSLGDATALVGLLVLRLRLDPSLERAVRFASRTDGGRLARALRRHARLSRGEPVSGMGEFAAEWSRYFPALDRAAAQLASATTVPPERRERALDRAMDAVVDATREEMAAYASGIRTPVTAIYAFGVLLPLALVGVLPAAPAAGVPVSLSVVVSIYCVGLPIGLLTAGAWLLARRPVAFPPPPVTTAHPDATGTLTQSLAVGVACASLGWVVAEVLAPGWVRPIAAVGVGAGTALWWWFRPVESVRERVRAVESGLPDALVRIGQRVAEGDAVERALERAAAETTGPAGEVLADAAGYGETFRVDVRTAFLAPDGALATVPSPRCRRAAALLGVAGRMGRPAGDVVLELATHLEELDRIEAEARGRLADVTGTLRNTATVFGPLVGGATVALSDRIRDVDALVAGGSGPGRAGGVLGTATRPPGAEAAGAAGKAAGVTPAADTAGAAFATGELGLAIGAYVLLLAALLVALATGLERGLDPASIGYRVGRALPIASGTYLVSFLLARAVL